MASSRHRQRDAPRHPRCAARRDARHGADGAGAGGGRAAPRIGRFGWKSQHASLQSFSADAYLNEMGITSPLFPEENTSSGTLVGFGTPYDPVADPEDDGVDVVAFANFMRSTKAPARGPITDDVTRRRAGCSTRSAARRATCHRSPRRAPGTQINGGVFNVPAALGNKIIHPYSDFPAARHRHRRRHSLPADAEFASTANQIRTAPLWALRTRNRLMHDGLSFTKQEAIQRHQGQAAGVTSAYNALPEEQKRQVLSFLDSL